MECTINFDGAARYYNTCLDTEVTAWPDGKPRFDPKHVFKTLYRGATGISGAVVVREMTSHP